jgi:hypothetical protein
VPGHAVDDAAARAELRPADGAVLALPAAPVVMHHHALADDGVGIGDALPAGRHHPAGFMPGDDPCPVTAEGLFVNRSLLATRPSRQTA